MNEIFKTVYIALLGNNRYKTMYYQTMLSEDDFKKYIKLYKKLSNLQKHRQL